MRLVRADRTRGATGWLMPAEAPTGPSTLWFIAQATSANLGGTARLPMTMRRPTRGCWLLGATATRLSYSSRASWVTTQRLQRSLFGMGNSAHWRFRKMRMAPSCLGFRHLRCRIWSAGKTTTINVPASSCLRNWNNATVAVPHRATIRSAAVGFDSGSKLCVCALNELAGRLKPRTIAGRCKRVVGFGHPSAREPPERRESGPVCSVQSQ
jgi:hypothetical protein